MAEIAVESTEITIENGGKVRIYSESGPGSLLEISPEEAVNNAEARIQLLEGST